MRKGQKSPNALPPGVAALRQMWRNYKYNAEARGLVWGLTVGDVECISQRMCFYCGLGPEMDAKTYYRGGRVAESFRCNGLDRYDNGLGYTLANTVACCKMCNIGKNNHTADQFRAWVKRAYLHMYE